MYLDQSHRTVLKNFSTFQRAQRCLEEAEEYLQAILKEVADELSGEHPPNYQFALGWDGWRYLQTRAFPDWDKSGAHLITVGIEKLAVPDIIVPDSDGRRAYIYSEVFADTKRAPSFTTLAKHIRQMEPPEGFSPAPLQMHGYFFLKRLGTLTADVFCSRSELKAYFKQPLEELVAWLIANAAHLASLGGTDTPATPQNP